MPPASTISDMPRQSQTDFLQSGLFTEWHDPETGVVSYILTKRVAPLQQSFYFLSPSITDDGRYYWFYCAFPPSGSDYHGRTLAVADLLTGQIIHHPNTQFLEASPLVDRRTGDVYWCNPVGIWKLAPHAGAEAVLVNRFTPEFVGQQDVRRYATHLTFSADGTALNIDAEVGHKFYIGSAPLDGGEIEIWQEMDHCYKHGQWNPVDPDLMLIAQDHWVDRKTWTPNSYGNRLWLIRRGEQAESIYSAPIAADAGKQVAAHEQDRRTRLGHEWWSADGQYILYAHYGHGVERIALGASEPERIWNIDNLWHAHADASVRFLVCDNTPFSGSSDWRVTFYDSHLGRELSIVSRMPELQGGALRYHIHPHPHFCLGDSLICYTTTVLGQPDVAFTRVNDLEDLIKSPQTPL
jgi:hypothetical protein